MAKEKERIVALQKQLKLAREALNTIAHGGRNHESVADNALDAINQIEWTVEAKPCAGRTEIHTWPRWHALMTRYPTGEHHV